MNRMFARVKMAIIVLAMLCGSTFFAQPAQAATVNGCHLVACITVYTGAKNHSNHTQWVGSIQVVDLGNKGKLEAWTQGFYKQISGRTDVTWTINRWVSSGQNVCGAVTQSGVPRRIACIAIRV